MFVRVCGLFDLLLFRLYVSGFAFVTLTLPSNLHQAINKQNELLQSWIWIVSVHEEKKAHQRLK